MTISRPTIIVVLICSLLLMTACDSASEPEPSQLITDEQLQSRIETVLTSTPDVPHTLRVAVSEGRVAISGSLACEDCGGRATPATSGTIQQTLGALVRAVPGVVDVEFLLTTEPL